MVDDFSDEERVVGIEANVGQRGLLDVAATQLAPGPYDEIRDALLGLDALIDMVVPAEDHADAVFDEHRLERRPQRQGRTVRRAGRVKGMMEHDDLPGFR